MKNNLYLNIVLTLILVCLVAFLIFFDTYWFKITPESTMLIKCNKKTGVIYFCDLKHAEDGWYSINKVIEKRAFNKAIDEVVTDESLYRNDYKTYLKQYDSAEHYGDPPLSFQEYITFRKDNLVDKNGF